MSKRLTKAEKETIRDNDAWEKANERKDAHDSTMRAILKEDEST